MPEIEGPQNGGNYIPQGAELGAFSAPNVGVESAPVAPESTATTGLTKAAGLEASGTELPAHDLGVSTWEDEGGLAPPIAEAA